MMTKQLIGLGKLSLLALIAALMNPPVAVSQTTPTFWSWAEQPVMGWNSWDFYGTTVTEAQTKAQADYMASNLLAHGWELITVDIQWYAPNPAGDGNYFNYETPNDQLIMDGYGRLQPATTRFPSATNSTGFTSLAAYVHSKGLKFGIHMMRGIPRQAVVDDLPVYGTSYTAQDIADTSSICPWNPDMYGVDMSQPGAQEYYDALYQMYANWGVDFVKIDDISRPYDSVQQAEIEAIREAIDKTGRPIVFSLSPGETPLGKGDHVMFHANQWRISDDFWDNWGALYAQFQRLHDWTPYRGPGHFPDADMLPLGKVEASTANPDGRTSNFTQDEQYTLISLWAIARSPLIHGGDMTQMDSFTLSLMTNDEVIAVNKLSTHNHQRFRSGDQIAWVADAVGSSNKYLAVFNTSSSSASVPVDLTDLGYNGSCTIRRLWDHTDLGATNGTFSPAINAHGAELYRLSGAVLPTPWLSDISAGNTRIDLAWEAVDSADSYSVKRSLSEAGPFAVIAGGVTNTAYTDTAVTNGTAYYYAISADVGGQESPNSNVRYEIPAGPTRIVSWNYNRYSDAYGTQSTDVAGLVPASYWNDTWLDGRTTDLLGDSGSPSTIDITWASYNTWSIQGSHPGTDTDGSYNKEILNGYLNSGPATWNPPITYSEVTLSEIAYAAYDLIVYFSSDVANREGYVTDGSTTNYFRTLGPASIASGNALFVQATNTTVGGYAEGANYAVFDSLSGSEQIVRVQMRDNDEWGGIAAVQVVAYPGFAPVINKVSVDGGGTVAINWTSDAVGTYEIQSKTNLNQATWVPVSGATGLSGGSGIDTSFMSSGNREEYFRVFGK